jgi:hypothetical protein
MSQEDDEILAQRRRNIENRRANIREISRQGRLAARAALLQMDSAPEAETSIEGAISTAFNSSNLPENPCQTARDSIKNLRAEWYMRIKAGDPENILSPQEIRARVDQVILSLTAQVDQAVREAETVLFAPTPDAASTPDESPPPQRRGRRK